MVEVEVDIIECTIEFRVELEAPTEIEVNMLEQGPIGKPGLDGINGTNGILQGETMQGSGTVWTIAHPPLGYVFIFDGSAFLIPTIDYTQVGQTFTFLGGTPTYPYAVYPVSTGANFPLPDPTGKDGWILTIISGIPTWVDPTP